MNYLVIRNHVYEEGHLATTLLVVEATSAVMAEIHAYQQTPRSNAGEFTAIPTSDLQPGWSYG